MQRLKHFGTSQMVVWARLVFNAYVIRVRSERYNAEVQEMEGKSERSWHGEGGVKIMGRD